MGLGLFNNETSLYEEDESLLNGLWLEDENNNLWIIPGRLNQETGGTICISGEIEGSDDVVFSEGVCKGQNIIDRLNREVQIENSGLSDHQYYWDSSAYWLSLGLSIIPNYLKRFTEEDGYYHA